MRAALLEEQNKPLVVVDDLEVAEPGPGLVRVDSRVPSLLASGVRPPSAARSNGQANWESLARPQVDALLREALARWQAAGVDTAGLGSIVVHIADLPGDTLGLASGNTIWLDADAAGWGWFVDPTPGDDLEFTKPGDQREQGRMDLLTAILHELGHLLDRDHDDSNVKHGPPAGSRSSGVAY